MGIFRRRRRLSDAQREARWRKTQEIVNGIFPANRSRSSPDAQEQEQKQLHPPPARNGPTDSKSHR
jgi:hypothetical protein